MKDQCTNCGAWKGLHHYETNQCPRNGQEAPLGKLQEWDNTVYQEDNTADLRAKIDEQAATIARLTADAKLADMAWTDNQAALNKQAEEIIALKKACIVYHNQIINMQKAEEE